jgi:bifunctional DNA primase/polymerase-like protein
MMRKSRSNWRRKAKRARAHDKPHESKRKQHNNKDADVTDRSTLDVALQYAAAGLPVFPLHGKDWSRRCTCGDPKCSQPGRHPRVKDATTDPRVVTRYWGKWPDAEIGVPLGSSSGFVALVINGPIGRKTLRALEEKAK